MNGPYGSDRSLRQGTVVKGRQDMPAVGVEHSCGGVVGKDEDGVRACGWRTGDYFRADAAEPSGAHWRDGERRSQGRDLRPEAVAVRNAKTTSGIRIGKRVAHIRLGVRIIENRLIGIADPLHNDVRRRAGKDRMQHGALEFERVLHFVEDDEREPTPQPGSGSREVLQKRTRPNKHLVIAEVSGLGGRLDGLLRQTETLCAWTSRKRLSA